MYVGYPYLIRGYESNSIYKTTSAQSSESFDINQLTGSKIAVLSTGFIGNNVTLALSELTNSDTIAHYDFGFVKPLDENLLHEIFTSFATVITIEDGVIKGGFGSGIIEFASQNNYQNTITSLGIPDVFIEQGTVAELQKMCKIDVESLITLFSTSI